MTSDDAWREEPIGRQHDRGSFDCGVPALNDYLVRFARQTHNGGGAKTFVAVSPDHRSRVLAYYTISPSAIAFEKVPLAISKGLGQYELPVYRLARLAVSLPFHGRLIGSRMLFAAARRAVAVAAQVGGMALAIDAKNEIVAQWYARFGAVPLHDAKLNLILPFASIDHAIRDVQDEGFPRS